MKGEEEEVVLETFGEKTLKDQNRDMKIFLKRSDCASSCTLADAKLSGRIEKKLVVNLCSFFKKDKWF